jgi:hypothetical protein
LIQIKTTAGIERKITMDAKLKLEVLKMDKDGRRRFIARLQRIIREAKKLPSAGDWTPKNRFNPPDLGFNRWN